MNKSGYMMLNIATAFYLSVNGIMAISRDRNGELVTFVDIIFKNSDFFNTFLVFISISAFAASIFLLLPLFKIEISILDNCLFFYGIGWVSFIVVVDIIHPIFNKVIIFPYLRDLAIHLMVLGTLFTAIKRFNRKSIKNVE
jgi:hypothetical protein